MFESSVPVAPLNHSAVSIPPARAKVLFTTLTFVAPSISIPIEPMSRKRFERIDRSWFAAPPRIISPCESEPLTVSTMLRVKDRWVSGSPVAGSPATCQVCRTSL
jgi:hypothetical protein